MSRYNVRNIDTNEVTSNLRVSDLKEMAKDGRLRANDRIRKEGHTTWHLASVVDGLDFLEVTTTSNISLNEPTTEPLEEFSIVEEKPQDSNETGGEHIGEETPEVIVSTPDLEVSECIMNTSEPEETQKGKPKSKRNLFIALGIAAATGIAGLLIVICIVLFLVFGGSNDTQWHINQLMSSGEKAVEAIEDKDITAYIVALEELTLVWESVADNWISLGVEIRAMDQGVGRHHVRQVVAIEDLLESYYPRLPYDLTPTQEEEEKISKLERRVDKANDKNVIYALLLP